MFRAVYGGLRFWWRASAGYRMTPWKSPYLRWRMETFSGIPAETLCLRDFVALGWREWRQVGRFFRWCRELEGLAAGRKS